MFTVLIRVRVFIVSFRQTPNVMTSELHCFLMPHFIIHICSDLFECFFSAHLTVI